MKSLKIVLIRTNPILPDPPVEKVADSLVRCGHEVTILAWDRYHDYYMSESEISLLHSTAKIVRFGIPAQFGGGIKKNLKNMILFQLRIFKWLKNNRDKYDIIHAFDFDTGFTSSIIAKLYRKKIVYHILDYFVASHGMTDSVIGKCIAKLENITINHADATIICTEKRKEQIAGTKPKRLEIIHNTPQNHMKKDKSFHLKSNSDRCKIAFVGTLSNRRFIHETAQFVIENPEYEFHIGGFGPIEKELQSISENNDRIFFYGKLSYDKTLALEEQCDLMIAIYDPGVTNHKYAAPNKFYESLMLGKPIIMAENTGFDEIITNNDIGCIISYDYEGLKKGFEYLMANRDKWAAMKKRSNDLYNEKYSWSVMEKRLLAIYENIIDS